MIGLLIFAVFLVLLIWWATRKGAKDEWRDGPPSVGL